MPIGKKTGLRKQNKGHTSFFFEKKVCMIPQKGFSKIFKARDQLKWYKMFSIFSLS